MKHPIAIAFLGFLHLFLGGCATTSDEELQFFVQGELRSGVTISPWLAAYTSDYSGNYSGEMGDTQETMRIRVHAVSGGYAIDGLHTSETAGMRPVGRRITSTLRGLGEAPYFAMERASSRPMTDSRDLITGPETAQLVLYSNPDRGPNANPIPGVIVGDLFLARTGSAN